MRGARFDFEVGIPVTSPITPTGRVIASTLPAFRVARATYLGLSFIDARHQLASELTTSRFAGEYEGLGDAWGEFMGKVKAEHAVRDELWEVYVTGPETGADSSKWQTELNLPLA